jgi:hypothetical protein
VRRYPLGTSQWHLFFLYFLFIFDFVCNINPPHNFVWVQLFVALFTNGAKAYFEDNRKVSFC